MVLASYKLIYEYRLYKLLAQMFGLAVVRQLFHAGMRTSFPGEESRMPTVEFITALFYQVDNHLHDLPKHPDAHLWPSEVVTLGLLHALKGVGNRAFYRNSPLS